MGDAGIPRRTSLVQFYRQRHRARYTCLPTKKIVRLLSNARLRPSRSCTQTIHLDGCATSVDCSSKLHCTALSSLCHDRQKKTIGLFAVPQMIHTDRIRAMCVEHLLARCTSRRQAAQCLGALRQGSQRLSLDCALILRAAVADVHPQSISSPNQLKEALQGHSSLLLNALPHNPRCAATNTCREGCCIVGVADHITFDMFFSPSGHNRLSPRPVHTCAHPCTMPHVHSIENTTAGTREYSSPHQ